MKLYEINQEINSLVDEETGEITDIARFQELQLAENDKLEAIAVVLKNNDVDVNALKEEAKVLLDRAKAIENRNENTKAFLAKYMLEHGIKKSKHLNVYCGSLNHHQLSLMMKLSLSISTKILI